MKGLPRFEEDHENSEYLGRKTRLRTNPAPPVYQLLELNLSATGRAFICWIFCHDVNYRSKLNYRRLMLYIHVYIDINKYSETYIATDLQYFYYPVRMEGGIQRNNIIK